MTQGQVETSVNASDNPAFRISADLNKKQKAGNKTKVQIKERESKTKRASVLYE